MSGLVSGLQNRPGRFDSATHLKGRGTQSSPFFVFKYHYIGPYPIHDVVVTAVSAAVSTATITFTTTSQKFFLSFIILYFFTSSIYPSRFSERSEFRSACPLSQSKATERMILHHGNTRKKTFFCWFSCISHNLIVPLHGNSVKFTRACGEIGRRVRLRI